MTDLDAKVEEARAKGGSPGAACYAFWPHELAALEAAIAERATAPLVKALETICSGESRLTLHQAQEVGDAALAAHKEGR